MDIQIVAEQFYEYSLSIRGYSKATIRRYKHVIHAFGVFTGIHNLEDVNSENLRALFYYGRSQRKWSVHTFKIYHMTLLVFFRWCIKQGLMERNPVEEIEVPRAEKHLPKRLRKQDALRILDIVANYPCPLPFLRIRNHAIFSTFLFAGLRKQELLHLKYTDVDLENRSIFIRQGKGNKDRIIPISFILALTLKKYIDARKKLGKTCPEFFVSSNRNLGYTDDGLKRLVKQISEASNVQFTVHQLRHTFATLMLEGGCDIYSLSKMMGHSDIKTTTIYLSASVEHLREQMIKHPLNIVSKPPITVFTE